MEYSRTWHLGISRKIYKIFLRDKLLFLFNKSCFHVSSCVVIPPTHLRVPNFRLFSCSSHCLLSACHRTRKMLMNEWQIWRNEKIMRFGIKGLESYLNCHLGWATMLALFLRKQSPRPGWKHWDFIQNCEARAVRTRKKVEVKYIRCRIMCEILHGKFLVNIAAHSEDMPGCHEGFLWKVCGMGLGGFPQN